MSDIFISHAVADQLLAKLLVDFLKEAIGVPTSAIFCSSVKGHDVRLAEDFNAYIKKKIQEPKLVILLMTPAYMESSFCLMELGAAWAQGSRSLAVVVPPTDFQSVTKTLGLKQAWKITDKAGLIDLKQLVTEAITGLEKRSEHTWDDKRVHWGVDLKKLLPKLQQTTKVDAKEHQEVLAELKNKNEEIEGLESALTRAQEQYTELEKLKNKEEVKALKKTTGGSQALQEEFNELIKAVRESKPRTATAVLKHIILDYFDLAGSIDWTEKQEFEEAVKYGLISPDDGSVQWNREKLKPFKNALQAVHIFMTSEEGAKLRKLQEADVPMDPDDLEFWEHHLRI